MAASDERTEMLELQRELDLTLSTTDTLRAQAHEFSNRLHTISGLIELGEYGEVAGYVQRVSARHAELTEQVTSRIADPAVAALLALAGVRLQGNLPPKIVAARIASRVSPDTRSLPVMNAIWPLSFCVASAFPASASAAVPASASTASLRIVFIPLPFLL